MWSFKGIDGLATLDVEMATYRLQLHPGGLRVRPAVVDSTEKR